MTGEEMLFDFASELRARCRSTPKIKEAEHLWKFGNGGGLQASASAPASPAQRTFLIGGSRDAPREKRSAEQQAAPRRPALI